MKKVSPSGAIRYYNELGQFHREDGPAIERVDGPREYWIHGEYYKEKEYNMITFTLYKKHIREN